MRRVLTLLTSLAVTAGLTVVVAAPAQAAPGRGDTKDNPIIFVHGFAASGGHDCNSTWLNARTHLRNEGWTGPLSTFGYYGGSTNCTFQHDGNRDTSIHTVAHRLADVIYDEYSSNGVKVDVVAHSMGGLVIRSALLNVQRNTPGWPPYLYVEDVITLATPHEGAQDANFCAFWLQCRQMIPGSVFFDELEVLGTGTGGRPKLPVSAMGTDWTVMSSFEDDITLESSGVNVDASHRLQYNAAQCTGDEPGVEHGDFPRRVAGSFCVRIYTRVEGWTGWILQTSPVDRAYRGAYYNSSM
ncbi:esterase/lipase family protein [Plantactinospora sp. CA-294935]|uniref:esterase/lipase family protein n=1 Tax=Plantactinospora sp. CA-294935 TaxID=3240012 RepID=UPI003D8DD5BB